MSLLNSTPRARSGIRRPRAAALAHEGASLTSPQLASWYPQMGSADSDTLSELPILVSRTRDLVRNNGIASGGVQTLADNVVGTGLRMQATPNIKALGMTAEEGAEWSRDTESKWRAYASSTACDARRRSNFPELSTLAFKSAVSNSDFLALPIWEPEPLDKYATRFWLIESDRLCNPNGMPDSATLRCGHEINRFGRTLAYHIRKAHPGDVYVGGSLAGEWERIPAVTPWGRRRVIYGAQLDRPEATRGKPLFSAVITQFKQLDRYAGAELDAAVTNAMIAAFVESPMEFSDLQEMLGGDATQVKSYMEHRAKPSARARLKSGAIIPLYPGEKITAFNPGRPATAFGGYMEAVLRHIAAGLNLPYELLLKDFSKTNYSSARAALLEAWRYFRSMRAWFASAWAQPCYELWLEEAVSKGEVIAPGFYENRDAWCCARWIGAGRGWVDPVKEVQAAVLRIEKGLSTYEAECAEQGTDWEEVFQQQARERALRSRLGLPLIGMTGETLQVPEDPEDPEENGKTSGSPPGSPPDEPENDGDEPA